MNKYASLARAARKENKRQRMCDQKTAYPDEAAAFQKGQRSYKCPHCKLWHRSGKLAELIAKVKRPQ